MAKDWLLIETLGGQLPRVIAVGRKPQRGKVLRDQIREPRRRELVIDAVTQAYSSKSDYEWQSTARDMRVLVKTFLSPEPLGMVNALQVWVGRAGEEVPERLPAGAWAWDIRKQTCLTSVEAHAVYRRPPETSTVEISRVQSMYGITKSAHRQNEALQAAMEGPPGTEVQETWPIWRYDNVLRSMFFSSRLTLVNGKKYLHGITMDVTEGPSAAEPPLSFADCMIEADMASQVGAYSALIHLGSLKAISWLSAPMPGVQCDMTGHPALDPNIHPDDLATARELAAAVQHGPVEGTVRVRNTDGGWIQVRFIGVLMKMVPDAPATTAMVKLRAVN